MITIKIASILVGDETVFAEGAAVFCAEPTAASNKSEQCINSVFIIRINWYLRKLIIL
jgi:hypothetical protein